MRDAAQFLRAVHDIHQNPVKAGRVVTEDPWLWSSAYPGNAKLLVGGIALAGREIGVPVGGPGGVMG